MYDDKASAIAKELRPWDATQPILVRYTQTTVTPRHSRG